MILLIWNWNKCDSSQSLEVSDYGIGVDVTDSSLCSSGGNIPGFAWRDWIHPQNPKDISSLDSGLNLWPAKYAAEVLPTQLWPSFRLLVSCNLTHITVSVSEGVATIETWKFMMPVLGLIGIVRQAKAHSGL